jgi:amino acid transporter
MSRQKRTLNTFDAIALTVGSMVGAGIFTVLALTVKTAGPAAVLSWILVVLLSLPMAYCFSDLTGVLAQSGGPYVYIRDRTRRWIGLWVAWSFLLSAVGAAEALFMSLVGMFNQMGIHASYAIGVVILVALAVVVANGIHLGALVQRAFTVGTVGLLLLCIVIGLTHASGFGLHGHLVTESARHATGAEGGVSIDVHRIFPFGWSAVLPATFYAFWTYSGWEAVIVPSESYASSKALARGMMIGSILVGLLYILVALACVLSQPTSSIVRSMNPLVGVGNLLHPAVGVLIAWGAIVIVVGSLLSWLIASATLVQAVARDGLFPAPKRLREYQGEYHPSIPVVIALLLVLGAALPIFAQAIAASSLMALIPYAVVFAVVSFFDKAADWQGVFKRRGTRRAVAFIACVMSIALIVFSGWNNIWPTLLLLTIGAGLIWLRHDHVNRANSVHSSNQPYQPSSPDV